MGCTQSLRKHSVDVVEMQTFSGFLACEIGDPEEFIDYAHFELIHVLQIISIAIKRWMSTKLALQDADIEFLVRFPDSRSVRCFNGDASYLDTNYSIEERSGMETDGKYWLSSELKLKFQWPRISPTIHYRMQPSADENSRCQPKKLNYNTAHYHMAAKVFEESMKVVEFWLNIWLKEREYAMRLKVSEASISLSCILSNPSLPLEDVVEGLASAISHIVDASSVTLYLKDGRRPRKLVSKLYKCTPQENEGLLWRHRNDINQSLSTGESSLHFQDIKEDSLDLVQSVVCLPLNQDSDDVLRPLRASAKDDDDTLSDCFSEEVEAKDKNLDTVVRNSQGQKSPTRYRTLSSQFKLESVDSVVKLISPSIPSEHESRSISSAKHSNKFCNGLLFIVIKRKIKVSNVELIGLNEAALDVSDICMTRKAELRFFGDAIAEERGFIEDYLSGRYSPNSLLSISSIVPISNEGINSANGQERPKDQFFSTPDISPDDSILSNWCIDPFAYSDMELAHFIERMFFKLDLVQQLSIPVEYLRSFIWQLRTKYHDDNPFHNFFHAFSVVQNVFVILSTAVRSRDLLSPLEQAMMLTAAYGHDADHPGTTNALEMTTLSEKAIRYSDDSVLERHHTTVLFETILANNFTRNFSKDQFKEFRRSIIKIILSTDMSKHLQLCTVLSSRVFLVKRGSTSKEKMPQVEQPPAVLDKKRSRSLTNESSNVANAVQKTLESVTVGPRSLEKIDDGDGEESKESPKRQIVPFDKTKEQDRVSLMEIIMHCADLSGQTCPNPLALEWGRRIMDEFAKSIPMVKTQQERMKDQCFFISEILIPLWDPFVAMFPELGTALENLKTNYNIYRAAS